MEPYYQDDYVTLHHGDAATRLRAMPAGSVDCVVTSPPYFGLRDYGIDGQLGNEATLEQYVEAMRVVFAEARRVLADDGTLWLNLGDSYSTGAASAPPSKNLLGVPWRVALALQADGWILRNAIVWEKPNAMPEPVTDRLAGRHEMVFLLAKSDRYWFDLDAVKVPSTSDRAASRRSRKPADGWKPNSAHGAFNGHTDARNPGDVWSISTQPFPGAHFACMPPKLAERCILAGCRPGGTVLDPFSGSGTTGMVAGRLGRRYVGIELNATYLDLSLESRLGQTALI